MAEALKIGLILSATDKMSRVVDTAVNKSTARMRALNMQVNKSSGVLRGMGRSLGDAVQSLPGAQFFTNPIVAIVAATAGITKLGIANEQAAVSFEVLLGSQEKSTKLMKEMQQYADTTPFEKQDLYDASKTMLGFGVAQEKVMGDMKMLGDVSMGNRDRFQSLALAYSQITAAGKLQGQDLLQLVNAGYNPLRDISEMTGVSMGKLREAMREGGISANMVTLALNHATGEGGKFHNMTQRMGQTVGGKISTAIDSFKNRMLQLYAAISPILIPALDTLIKVLDSIAPPVDLAVKSIVAFIKFIKEGNPWIIGAATLITGIVIAANAATIAFSALSTVVKIATGIQMLFNGVLSISPLGWIVIAIAAVTATVMACWEKFSWFRAIIKNTWEDIKGFGNILKNFVIDRIKGIISGLGSMGSAISELFSGNFSNALEEAKKGIRDLSGYDATVNMIVASKNLIQESPTRFKGLLAQEEAVQAQKEGRAIVSKSESVVRKSNNNRINYAPTINMKGGTVADKEEFGKMLKAHKWELGNMLKDMSNNNSRLSFAQ